MAAIVSGKTLRYEDFARRGQMLFPGAERFIRAAAAAVPIAIASGALTHEIDEILGRAGLRALFTAVVGADQTMRSKPSPDPYLEAFSRIASAGHGAEPSRTVAIEDSMGARVRTHGPTPLRRGDQHLSGRRAGAPCRTDRCRAGRADPRSA